MRTLFMTVVALLLASTSMAGNEARAFDSQYDTIYAPTLTISPRQDEAAVEEALFLFDGKYLTTTYTFQSKGEDVLLQFAMPPVYRSERYIYRTMHEGLTVALQGKNVPLTHDSQAYSPKGENITPLLAEAGLTPNRNSGGLLQLPNQPKMQKIWGKLIDDGLIKKAYQDRNNIYEACWVVTNRWWAMVRLPEGKIRLSFRYQMLGLGGNTRFTETLEKYPDIESEVRLANIDLTRAFSALKPEKTDGFYFATWFPIPPAPMPWSAVPKLQFEAVWPVYSQYVQRPMYLAARIGDVEQQGLERISLTVENYSSIVPGIFCAINFSDKP